MAETLPSAGHEVVVALGSNLGDRMAHLRRAVEALGKVMTVTELSSVVESRAEGLPEAEEAPDFLNAVVRGRTALDPADLLETFHDIEEEAGRPRGRPPGSRTLDLDLIFFEDRVARWEGLRLPHPRWKERGFVLRPLLEVASQWIDPVTGETVKAVCDRKAHLLSRVRVVESGKALQS